MRVPSGITAGSTAITPTPTGSPLAVLPGRWYATASTTSVRVPAARGRVPPARRRLAVSVAGSCRRRVDPLGCALCLPGLAPRDARSSGPAGAAARRPSRASARSRREAGSPPRPRGVRTVGESGLRSGEVGELGLERAGVAARLGARARRFRVGRALEAVEPLEHGPERAGAEDHLDRVRVALDVEASKRASAMRAWSRGERITRRSRRLPSEPLACRGERTLPLGVPLGLRLCACELDLRREQLDCRGPLRRREATRARGTARRRRARDRPSSRARTPQRTTRRIPRSRAQGRGPYHRRGE